MGIESYCTLKGPGEAVYKDKGSRFLGFAFPVSGEEEARTILQGLRDRYPDATHHCYALVLKPDHSLQRFSDDGEPGNSAGRPILRQMQSAGISDALVVVVRYFGGVKLGIPGLIEGYGETARMAIINGGSIEKQVESMWAISCDYAAENLAYRVIRQLKGNVLSKTYEDRCRITFSVPILSGDKLRQLCAEIPKFELMQLQ